MSRVGGGEELVPAVRGMVTRMVRRGPDDEGIWTNDGPVVLGFRRLAVLDTSMAGHQPMASADGRHVIAFNGEIYNFRELRSELERLGHHFASSGDTPVLLAALREWGGAAVQRLNGMFAFAWYDMSNGSLMLARDRFGVKPLFVHRGSNGVVFGSQFDQIVSHPWVRNVAASPAGFAAFLRHGHAPPPLGILEGVTQVEAGTYMQIDRAGQVTVTRYQQPIADYDGPLLSGDALVDELDDAIARSVRRQLVSDVPVGVFLSGGIDSPLIAAHAARASGGRIQGFSIGSDEASMDESAAAARYARDLGIELHTEIMSEDRLLALLPDVLAASTHPIADFSIFPTLLVSRLAREHVTVALSGDGGDELFYGYPLRYGSILDMAPVFNRPSWMRPLMVGAARLSGRSLAFADARSVSLGALLERKQSIWPADGFSRFLPGLADVESMLPVYRNAPCAPDAVARWARNNDVHVHMPMILDKVDRASMYHSLEVRVPLLDNDVADVAARADWRSCIDARTRVGKLPLRAALARYTQSGTQAKKGFTAPMSRWLTGPLHTLVNDTLQGRATLLGMPFASAALDSSLRELQAGVSGHAIGIWTLLSVALWEDAQRAYRNVSTAAA